MSLIWFHCLIWLIIASIYRINFILILDQGKKIISPLACTHYFDMFTLGNLETIYSVQSNEHTQTKAAQALGELRKLRKEWQTQSTFSS